ncbi:hypothetical protein CHCC20335_1434 [Bacillus paralicheniformis]|nr:hypothetical protein CHCC20335_1434 [Bacillus paralicheniformis]
MDQFLRYLVLDRQKTRDGPFEEPSLFKMNGRNVRLQPI